MAADVFTLPSDHTESFGSVILEANAAGLNAVVTDDKIRRWMLADSGHFVDPRDSDCYAAALLEAAASKSSESALQNLKRFEWSAIAPQWLGFFNQIIEQSRTRQNSNKN